MEARSSRSRRNVCFVVLFMFVAMARMAGGHDGGDGEEEMGQRLMKLWMDGGPEAEEGLGWLADQEEDEYDEDDGVEKGHLAMLRPGRPPTGRNVVCVKDFGAAGDGIIDDTEAFLKTWEKACSLDNAVFLVPEGQHFKVNASRFQGPCKSKIIIEIQGTIVAPEEPAEWDPKSPRLWLLFSNLHAARIQGGGLIDGSGSKWWAASCKIVKSNPCKPAPTALTIDSSYAVRVKNLRIRNSPQMHFTVSRSRNVRVTGVHIDSKEDSPNTDGIHIGESTAVTVQNCRIATGDDCISIANASFYIKMKNIDCGPGHGISIGSLGKDNTTAAVEGVVLDTARISRAQNGVRIKTWQGGSGYVKNVRFDNVQMDGVDHPIIIDQFYCDSKTPCKNQTSAVEISQVMYRNIRGTSTRAEAMKFACSDTVPCRGIVLNDVELVRQGGEAAAEAVTVCNCAMGFGYGVVLPAADCLKNSACGGGGGTVAAAGNDTDEPILHTEL